MNRIRPSAAILARILIVAIFLASGIGIVDPAFATHEMIMRGVPANVAPLLVLGGRAVQILAGLGLAFGRYRRICAVGLILFLIPATLIAHSFWLTPTQLFQIQLVNFLKNLSMIGGLLFIASMNPDQCCEVSSNLPVEGATPSPANKVTASCGA
jgi:putative oxidoreductase